MAHSAAQLYPGETIADPDFLDGKFKNSTAPGVYDGTPLEQKLFNQQLAFFDAMMDKCNISYGNFADTSKKSQLFEVLQKSRQADNKIKVSQFLIQGATGDPLPKNGILTNYALNAEMADGWVVTSAVVGGTIDGHGNVSATSGIVKYSVSRDEHKIVKHLVGSCLQYDGVNYNQVYAEVGSGLTVTSDINNFYLLVDFSKINGVVFGLCENWGFLPILNLGEIRDLLPPIITIPNYVGEMAYHAGAIAPTGSLVCNGQEVYKTTYSRLYSVIGNAWATTGGAAAPAVGKFRVPPQNINAQGLFLRGNNAGVGTYQTDIIRNITGAWTPTGFITYGAHVWTSGAFSRTLNTMLKAYSSSITASSAWTGFTFNAGNVVPTGGENIPANISGLLCIKY